MAEKIQNLDEKRRSQVGSGMRGDKIRTIRVQDGIVTDHRKENKIRYKDYVRGNWEGLIQELYDHRKDDNERYDSDPYADEIEAEELRPIVEEIWHTATEITKAEIKK